MKIKIIFLFAIILFSSGLLLYVEKNNIIKLFNFYSSNSDVEFYYDNYGKEIIFQSDGLAIVGTLYGEGSDENKTIRPGIVLVHGETPAGRKLPVYKILAKEFVERGYIVLTFDRRGIGESEDPEQVNLVESWDERNEVINAISYIYNLKNIDKSKIYAIGHSGGAFPVMQAGLEDKRITKIVVIGPPRRIEERILNRSSPDLQYLWERKSTDRGLKEPIPLETFLSIILKLKMLYADYEIHDHIPIFLIDGELEENKDKLYMRNYFSELKEPKKYLTINDSDHYLNTSSVGNVMFFNNEILDETVNSIDNWFKCLKK